MRVSFGILRPDEIDPAAALFVEETSRQNAVWGAQERSLEEQAAILRQSAQRGSLFYALRGIDGSLLGVFTLSHVDPLLGQAEGGMVLRKELRGQGLGKAVSRRLMTDLVFGQLGLRRLYGSTLETNVAALRVAERLGMKREGQVPNDIYLNGKYVGTVHLGLTREDFSRSD